MGRKQLKFEISDNEVQHLETQVKVDVIVQAVLDIKEQRLNMGKVKELQTPIKVRNLGPANNPKHISKKFKNWIYSGIDFAFIR